MRVFGSVVTMVKVCLFFLNIYVLTMVVVVVLGKWPLFSSNGTIRKYDGSHLIVTRELNEKHSHDEHIAPVTKQPGGLKANDISPMRENKKLVSDVVETETRVTTLNYWCDRIRPQTARAVDLDVFHLQQILVDDDHKMLYCQIPEVAQTDWLRILVFLTGKVKVNNHLSMTSYDVHSKYNKYLKKLSDFSVKERQRRIKDYYKFVFVREPIERLVGVYRNKFYAKYSTYFHQTFGRKIIKKYRKNPSKASLLKGNDVTFAEFIQYLVDSERDDREPLNEHWEQYYKHCHPCLIRYNFVGTFENLQRDVQYVLKKTSAVQKLKPPLTSPVSPYSESFLTSMYKSVSTTNIRKLWKMYYPDYNLFSYQYPTVLDKLLKSAKVFEDY
ncbi:carbohydrate sulfotransferase 11-like [Gigantopelta aegis]|uniref:carbohydrate sulfotransferase 11-like n=1 Tax=Gigantopelta aegis TaxID=1735272 RepID=UPI001B8887E1|nr:carbohydrate sulfotransferase 11-like [Gigantopelta aegis]XP_041371692.1 carbohydrate sulfotransferase 11-like [Gigantopelta aegis]